MAIYSTGSYNRVIGGQLQYRDTLVDKVGQQKYNLSGLPQHVSHQYSTGHFLRRRKVGIKIVPQL